MHLWASYINWRLHWRILALIMFLALYKVVILGLAFLALTPVDDNILYIASTLVFALSFMRKKKRIISR